MRSVSFILFNFLFFLFSSLESFAATIDREGWIAGCVAGLNKAKSLGEIDSSPDIHKSMCGKGFDRVKDSKEINNKALNDFSSKERGCLATVGLILKLQGKDPRVVISSSAEMQKLGMKYCDVQS